jgi:hypothetical protein
MRLMIISLLILISAPLHAGTLSADGYGPTQSDARRNALGTLSESLKVEVKSFTSSATDENGLLYAKLVNESSSELPLLGTEFAYIDLGNEQMCTVTLNADKALVLYQRQIERLASDINALEQSQSRQQSPDARYRTLQQLYEKLDQIDDYITVALLLGKPTLPTLKTTLEKTANHLRSLESKAPSLRIAVSQLSRDLPEGRYFVEPAKAHGSRQITQLGRLLRDELEQRLATGDRNSADYRLGGLYEILDGSISVTYRAVDQQGKTVATRQVQLAASAYQGMDYEPRDLDYDRLLNDGYIVNNQFRAALTTNFGNEALALREGDVVRLLAKLNAPGFFYIVAHDRTNGFSYLLEINDALGDDRFVVSVDQSQVNRWIALSEDGYEIVAPFGTEDLQLMATRDYPRLPPARLDRQGYYVLVADSPKEAVIKTRGMRPKASKSQGPVSAETTLTYTSSGK